MTTNPLALIPPTAVTEAAARKAQLCALFDQLDDRGQKTTLALLATAAKLHPRSPA